MCIVKIKKSNVRYYVNLTFTFPQTYHLYIYLYTVYKYKGKTPEKNVF